jgi:hypothetical protein
VSKANGVNSSSAVEAHEIPVGLPWPMQPTRESASLQTEACQMAPQVPRERRGALSVALQWLIQVGG